MFQCNEQLQENALYVLVYRISRKVHSTPLGCFVFLETQGLRSKDCSNILVSQLVFCHPFSGSFFSCLTPGITRTVGCGEVRTASFALFAITVRLIDIAGPIQRVDASTYMLMKPGVRPVFNLFRPAVFHRIPMNIIHMSGIVFLVSD